MKQSSIWMCGLSLMLAMLFLVSAQSFYSTGGRYGKRENPQIFQDTHIARRSSRIWGSRGPGDVQQVAPRAERFFMGSRYGKRSDADAETISLVQQQQPAQRPVNLNTNGDSDDQLSCLYTGVVNLYRCINSKERPPETEVTAQGTAEN